MPPSQKPISSALTSATADLNHVVTVTGIKVTYKAPRKKYPVSVQIMIGDKVTNKSREYRKHQEVSWDINKQFSSEAKLIIVVREHHRIKRRDRYFRTVVSVADMVMKPVLVIDGGEVVSMIIYCETGGPFVELIRKLIEEAQDRLSSMKTFMEKLGNVCEALNIIVAIAEPLGDAHPAAKAAVKVATLLYERCTTLQECHAAATELMEDIASFLPFTEIPIEHCKSSVTIQTAESLLKVFEKISRAIIDSSTDTILGFLLKDRLEEVGGYKEKLKKLRETFDWCVKTEIWKTVLRIETHTANLLLARLRPVDSVFYASEKSCFEGTRKDTLDIIERWASSDSKIFWLYGSEGSGKSTIAHTVAQLFDEQNRLAGCFFFDGCGRERRNPEAVISTIAYHLAKWHEPYFSLILNLLSGPAERNIHSSLVSKFELLMRKPLTELSKPTMAKYQPPSHQSLIIVLDALEQCCNLEYSRLFLVEYIKDIAELVPWLKVFISSRKLPEFDVLLGTGCQELDIGDPRVDFELDMAAYVKFCAMDEALYATRERSLDYKTPGLFSRINWVCRRLSVLEVSNDLVEKAVQVQRPGMDELFHFSTAAIMSRSWYAKDMVPIIRDVLAVIAFVIAISGKPPIQDLLHQILRPFWPAVTSDALSDLLRSLRPVLSFDGSEVKLLFPADLFLDLLSDKQRSGAFAIDIDMIRNGVTRRCLNEMDAHLRFILCRLDSSYLLNMDTEYLAARIKSRIPEVLHYSCLSWMDLVITSGNAHAFHKTVLDFLCSPKILVWLEVLSLTARSEMSKGILLKCIDFFKDHNDVCEVAKELHDFVSSNDTAMELSAPHVYLSTSTWLSGDSFPNSRTLHFVSNRPKIVFESSATKKIAGRHIDSEIDIWSLTCSSDSNRIVSVHRAGTLNIWDGRTGVNIHGPLSGHSSHVSLVLSVAFSGDGSRIISGTRHRLRIRDTLSGVPLDGPFKTKSTVRCVAFRPDGSRFVSGHKDGRIRIWDTRGDYLFESMECHLGLVSAVAYSPDGNRIVTGSVDYTLRIWNAKMAASIGNPLKGHRDWIWAVAYSPDGSKILSGSDDRTVRIWDAETGEQLGMPLEGHEGRVVDIGYSRDGSRILSSSQDEIRMWDAISGAPLGVVHRGESRWDTERQCFVSIPSWWPEEIAPKVQSLLLSANPLYAPDDGWIRTLDDDLLLWFPPEHRGCACHTTQDSTVTRDEHDERILNSDSSMGRIGQRSRLLKGRSVSRTFLLAYTHQRVLKYCNHRINVNE